MAEEFPVSFDAAKREKTLLERDLDFLDAAKVFEGQKIEFEDTRADYGERRMICFGFLNDRLVAIVYVQRGNVRRIISMRKANDREQAKFQDGFRKT